MSRLERIFLRFARWWIRGIRLRYENDPLAPPSRVSCLMVMLGGTGVAMLRGIEQGITEQLAQ